MKFLGIAAALLLVVFTLLIAVAGRRWPLELIYIRVSWLPAPILPLMFLLRDPLLRHLGYGALLLLLLVIFASFLFAIMGVVLVMAGRGRGSVRPGLYRAVLIAAIPAVVASAAMILSALGLRV
ncbi:MAG: hypothetical protein ACRD96_25885 [Bryobacteraceae bacterium]